VQLLTRIEWIGLFETNNSSTIILDNSSNLILDTINGRKVSKFHTGRNHRKLKPWITIGLVTSIKNRDKINMKTKRDSKNIKLIKYPKKYRNKLSLLLREAKEQYYSIKIKTYKGNGRETWQIINELTSRKNLQLRLRLVK